ncbi:hypothetical protein JCM14713_15300 [Desulfomicrobium salsuginis]
MDYCDYQYPFCFYAIDEMVAVDQSFPDAWIAEFRNNSSTVRQGAKAPCAFHNRLNDSACIKIGITLCVFRSKLNMDSGAN